MSTLLRMEFKKALQNQWFVIAVGVGLALALASAFGDIAWNREYGVTRVYSYKYLSPSPGSPFKWWISLDFAQPTSTLLFQLLPLLVCVPYAWSFRSELQSGYVGQVLTRQPRPRYLVAKGAAVFVSASLVAMIPLAANFLVLACFLPAYVPDVLDVIYLGIYPYDLWSWFFYNVPLVYVLLYTLLAGALCGLWASVVYGLSFLVDNRVTLLVAPYLGLFGLQFVSDRIWLVLGISGLQLGLSANMRAGAESYFQSGWVILAEALIMLFVSVFLAWHQRRRDLL